MKVLCARARFHSDDDAEQDERDQRACFGSGENILHPFPKIQSARVHEREQSDHYQTKKLCSGK